MKNKYIKVANISEEKFRLIVKCFSNDLSATQTANLTGINRNTINRYYTFFRERIARIQNEESPLSGEIELDESYFGARRVRGKRGRGASGKTIVFGLLKRNDKVYTQIVPDAKKATLQAIIRGKIELESIIHTDGWRGYDGLVDIGYDKHFRVHHGKNEFARGNCHINGIESFWSYAKIRLVKFRGLEKSISIHISKNVSLGSITEVKIYTKFC
ncbi:Mobile element protein [hydrothermal vent metagenome]|uniref:Mobile element protein n=1 Tax=hydrothermal vent metagenome TaxID=652676 RepID=A0A1W1EB55_9ZZZZ